MTAAEVLVRAEALIGERGWCQLRFRDFDGRFCAVGAIEEVAPNKTAAQKAQSRLRRQIGKRSVMDWNDTPGRTEAEVRAAMLAAAKEAA